MIVTYHDMLAPIYLLIDHGALARKGDRRGDAGKACGRPLRLPRRPRPKRRKINSEMGGGDSIDVDLEVCSTLPGEYQ